MATRTLARFKSDPRVLKILGRKPGDEGFSLIELVVVIAVLAILSAVALPNFLGVQKDGQVASAKNTLANVVKECVVSGLRGTGTSFDSIQSTQGKLNGYTISSIDAASCYSAKAIGENDLPDYTIVYNTGDGTSAKTCDAAKNDYAAGCFKNDTLAETVDTAPGAQSGSW